MKVFFRNNFYYYAEIQQHAKHCDFCFYTMSKVTKNSKLTFFSVNELQLRKLELFIRDSPGLAILPKTDCLARRRRMRREGKI